LWLVTSAGVLLWLVTTGLWLVTTGLWLVTARVFFQVRQKKLMMMCKIAKIEKN
jgi:hypothetical protein